MSSRKSRPGHRSARRQPEPHALGSIQDHLFGDPTGPSTKTIQLCRQVEEAVSCALACSASATLRDLFVVGVQPIKGAAQLRVLLSREGDDHDYEHTQHALNNAQGYLRAEVARSIHRKRVPTLTLVVVPPAVARGGRDE